jgi:cytochrome c oxidase cbb3-type subunit 3
MRAAALAIALATLSACGQYERATPSPAATSAEHEAGRRIYNYRCYFCHGYSGDARTLAARMIEPLPRDFTQTPGLNEERVASVLRTGIPGTAMTPFTQVLTESEIATLARFVVTEFVTNKSPNTHYHTVANGWPNHERYAVAFPFATGAIPLDRPAGELSAAERSGRRLFMDSCITCHDRSNVLDIGTAWSAAAGAIAHSTQPEKTRQQ